MFHLLFQGAAVLSLRYFFARLSGTFNIAVSARLSDTLPPKSISIFICYASLQLDIDYTIYCIFLNKLSFNITSLLSTLYIPNLFNDSSPNILTNTSYGLFQFKDFLGVELM